MRSSLTSTHPTNAKKGLFTVHPSGFFASLHASLLLFIFCMPLTLLSAPIQLAPSINSASPRASHAQWTWPAYAQQQPPTALYSRSRAQGSLHYMHIGSPLIHGTALFTSSSCQPVISFPPHCANLSMVPSHQCHVRQLHFLFPCTATRGKHDDCPRFPKRRGGVCFWVGFFGRQREL